ncbi:glycosyltransferase [Mitsuokella multacida]|uniref:glycosyltransferase n=1 Tax=Mitsuokella multacida TaxID=52226 RepID=UPI003F7F69ED
MERVVYIVLSSHIAGTERHVLDLMNGVKRNAVFKPILIAYPGAFIKQASDNDIECYTVIDNKLTILYQLYRVIKKVHPSIVHAHLGTSGLYGRLAAFFARVPVILYTDHAWAQRNIDLSALSNFFHIIIYRLLSKITNKIIAVSIPVEQYLLTDIKIPREKLIRIENGIDSILFSTNNKKIDLKDDTIIFICVGRLEKEKNQMCVLLAAKELIKEGYDFEIRIIGDGSQKESLYSFCKNNNMLKQVRFLGYIPNKRLKEFYSDSDILILPSLRETFGLVLLEAMACYCPCIASNVGGIPYIIRDGVNGYLFYSDDYKSLAKKMEFVINHKDIIPKLAQNARNIVCRDFSVDKMVRRTEEVYIEELKR